MKPTTTQQALIHTAESAGISGLMTVAGGVYQYVFAHGLNIPGLLGFLGTSFVAQMLMIYKSVKSSPQLGQAVVDTSGEVKASLASLGAILGSHSGMIGGLAEDVQTIKRWLTAAPTPPTAIGQAAPSLQPPAPPAPAFGNLFPVTSTGAAQITPPNASSASVPQQPFPPLNWTGITHAVPK